MVDPEKELQNTQLKYSDEMMRRAILITFHELNAVLFAFCAAPTLLSVVNRETLVGLQELLQQLKFPVHGLYKLLESHDLPRQTLPIILFILIYLPGWYSFDRALELLSNRPLEKDE